MKIFDRNPAGLSPAEAGKTQETSKTGSGGVRNRSGARSGEDSVQFSSVLDTLRTALSASDGGREARVEALRAQYRAGAYVPDVAAISRGLVDDAVTGGTMS